MLLRTGLIIAVIFTLLCTSAHADFVPRVGVEPERGGGASVTVNGRRTVLLQTSNGKLSPAERANIVATRLTDFLEKGGVPEAIWYKKVGESAHVMTGETLLIIATPEEARKQKASPVSLAQTWVKRLREHLSIPPLRTSATSMLVPLGENRTLAVESLLDSQMVAEVSDPDVIKVDGKLKPGALVVTGLKVGAARITIKSADYRVDVPVSVKRYAAYPSPVAGKAVITGQNPSPNLARLSVEEAARQSVSLEPGGKITELSPDGPTPAVRPGGVARLLVRAVATAPDCIPARFNVRVDLENRILPSIEPAEIMYSNDPERVLKYQVLFTGKLDGLRGDPVRLLYHHQNMMRTKIGFVIELINPTSTPAQLHVIEGVSYPMLDTVLVGYRAGLDFMDNIIRGTGRVVHMPPGTRRVLVSQQVEYPYTASGIMEFRQLSGEPLFLRVIAKPNEERLARDPVEMVLPYPIGDSASIVLSDHVYPSPTKNLEARYTVGKPWVFLRIGKQAIKHATQERQLYGNYGVTYDIKLVLENPLDVPHTAELAFEATAGPASGVFLVDGDLVRVRFLQNPAEATLTRITIPPGRSREVSVRTIPLSGSAYPVTLIVRPGGASVSLAR